MQSNGASPQQQQRNEEEDPIEAMKRKSRAFFNELSEDLDKATWEVQQQRAKLEKERHEFEEKLKVYEESVVKAQLLARQNETHVTLNVGGETYHTSTNTLCVFPESVFSVLFCGEFPVDRDEQGNVFIDRNPKYFKHILEYLRISARGEMKTNKERFTFCEKNMSPAEMLEVREDALFFGVQSLADALVDVHQYTQCGETLVPHSGATIGSMVLTMAESNGICYVGSAEKGDLTSYELPSLNKITRVAAHADFVTSILIHGDTLITSSRDKTIKVWERGTFVCLAAMNEHTEYVQALCHFRGYIVSVSQDRMLKMWEVPTDPSRIHQTIIPSVRTMMLDANAKCVCASEELCFVGTGERIEVLDPLAGVKYASLVDPLGHVRCLAICARTNELVCGTWGKTVHFFSLNEVKKDLDTQVNTTTNGVLSCFNNWISDIHCFGSLLIVSSDVSVFFFDATTRLKMRQVSTHHSDVVRCVLMDSLRSQLLTGSFDGTIKLFLTSEAKAEEDAKLKRQKR